MMLIKTSEPSRQIEGMLRKSTRRRHLARRQDRNRDELRALAPDMSAVSDATRVTSASSHARHHTKAQMAVSRPGQSVVPWRIVREVKN